MIAPVLIGRAHQSDAPGAATPAGLTEWEISQGIQAAAMLLLSMHGIPAEALSGTLAGRITRANHGAACIVEPHCNASPDPSHRGCFVLVHHASEQSRALGRCILNEIAAATNLSQRLHGLCLASNTHRWIGTDKEYAIVYPEKKLGLLRDTQCPAVVVECCHLTNPDDAAWIAQVANRQTIGTCIGRGVVAWLGLQ